MKKPAKVLCLVNLAIHPRSKRWMPSNVDIKAIALAEKIANLTNSNLDFLNVFCQKGGQIDSFNYSLSNYFALFEKATSIHQINCNQENLSQQIANYADENEIGLIVCGSRSSGGFDSGLLPFELAHQLGFSLLSNALDLVNENSANLTVKQFVSASSRRNISLSSQTIISVHPNSPLNKPFIFTKKLNGKIIQWQSKNLSKANNNKAEFAFRQKWQDYSVEKSKIPFQIEKSESASVRMNRFLETNSSQLDDQIYLSKERSVDDKVKQIFEVLEKYQLLN